MRIEMVNPQQQLLTELTYPGITQQSVAITYAYIMAQEAKTADWPRINAAIRARWKGKDALERVKEMAWKTLEAWAR